MKNTLKVNPKKIYLINAYSNYDPKVFFISGSDKVAIELAKQDLGNSYIIGPSSLVSILPKHLKFFSSQNDFTSIIILDYLIRLYNCIKILNKLGNGNVLISTSDFFCDVIPAFIFRKSNKWITFTYHLYPSFFTNFKIRDFIGKFFQDFSYLLSNYANKNFTSNFECINYVANKFKNSRMRKIPLGVNLNLYISNPIKEIDIIFLGRIKESKGIFDLPEITSLIRSKIRDVEVVVIGNGPELEKNKLKDLDIKFNSGLKMLGSVSDEEVRDKLSKSKILIQLDSENGFGLNIVEALASGCLVSGYDLPSYRDNFPDLDLRMCSQNQTQDVANTIIKILNNYKNPQVPVEKLSRFDWNSIYKTVFSN